MAQDFWTVFKRWNDKKDWTDYKIRNKFGWKVLSIDDYNNFINLPEARKIFVKLGHSNIMGIDTTNNKTNGNSESVDFESNLLNVEFINDYPKKIST